MNLTSTQVAIVIGSGIVGAGYLAFIVAPAVAAYGRTWEKMAAGFLTLFILLSLLGMGSALGLALVWFYDRYA